MNVTPRLIPVHGHQIAVLEANQHLPGAPIVLLHGMFMSLRLWPMILPRDIADRRRWCSISLPGHDPSQTPPSWESESLNERLFADLLGDALLELIGEQPATLVGWSTGAFWALALAAHRSYQVESVCSIAGFAHGRWQGMLGWLQGLAFNGQTTLCRLLLRSMALTRAGFRIAIAQGGVGAPYMPPSPLIHPLLRKAYRDFRHHDPAALTLLMRAVAGFDLTPRLGCIEAPTLVVSVEEDSVIPEEQGNLLARRIRNARSIALPDTSHLFFTKNLARVHALLRPWLQTTPRFVESPRRHVA